MALITMRQLLDHAAENDYALPAFNVNNLEYIQAVMRAADATDSPVILQASRGARSYAGDAFLRHLILGAAEEYPHIPICLHLDHGDGIVYWPPPLVAVVDLELCRVRPGPHRTISLR